jgi:molybdopterin-guanine dinucleotide biosynthesis protein A
MVTGVILAGGQATRYGGLPKGLELVGGRRIIDRVHDALARVCDDVLLIANDDAADAWLPGVRRERDVRTGMGSLGGIHAALVHGGGRVLVVAWDMPFVSPALLGELRMRAGTADVIVPESDSRRGLEPLCAYYGPACVAPIERQLDAGDLRVIGFFDAVRVARVPAADVARHGPPSMLFLNVNTPEELVLAEAHAATTDGGRDRPEA